MGDPTQNTRGHLVLRHKQAPNYQQYGSVQTTNTAHNTQHTAWKTRLLGGSTSSTGSTTKLIISHAGWTTGHLPSPNAIIPPPPSARLPSPSPAHLEQQDAEARAAVASSEVVAIPQELQDESAAREGDAAADHHHLRAREARQEAHACHGRRGNPKGRQSQAENVALHGHEAGHAELQPHLEKEKDDAHLSEHLTFCGCCYNVVGVTVGVFCVWCRRRRPWVDEDRVVLVECVTGRGQN